MALEHHSEHEGTRQVHLYICLIVTFAAATISLTLRLIARHITRVPLWWDDWLALLAYLFAVSWTGLVVYWIRCGLGLYLDEIDLPKEVALERSRLLLWLQELIYGFSLAFSKLAVLGFYWRMFKMSTIKWPIQGLAVATVVWLILRIFLGIFHCVPVAKFWHPSLTGYCSIDDSRFFVGSVLAHLCLDVVILALPVIEVRKLKMPWSQRLGIMAMFGFGIFVCVASVLVIILSLWFNAKDTELPWGVTPIIIWATVEVNLAIVSACLPMLRPIALLILRRPLTKPRSELSYTTAPHSHLTSHKLHPLRTSDTESTVNLTNTNTRENSASPAPEAYESEHGNITVVLGPEDVADLEYGGRPRSGTNTTIGGTKMKKVRRNGNDRLQVVNAEYSGGAGGGARARARGASVWGQTMGGVVVTNETRVTSNSFMSINEGNLMLGKDVVQGVREV